MVSVVCSALERVPSRSLPTATRSPRPDRTIGRGAYPRDVRPDAAEPEVEAYVLGLLSPDDYQHNLIAQAHNKYFLDRHEDHPVRYRDLSSPAEEVRGQPE